MWQMSNRLPLAGYGLLHSPKLIKLLISMWVYDDATKRFISQWLYHLEVKARLDCHWLLRHHWSVHLPCQKVYTSVDVTICHTSACKGLIVKSAVDAIWSSTFGAGEILTTVTSYQKSLEPFRLIHTDFVPLTEVVKQMPEENLAKWSNLWIRLADIYKESCPVIYSHPSTGKPVSICSS